MNPDDRRIKVFLVVVFCLSLLLVPLSSVGIDIGFNSGDIPGKISFEEVIENQESTDETEVRTVRYKPTKISFQNIESFLKSQNKTEFAEEHDLQYVGDRALITMGLEKGSKLPEDYDIETTVEYSIDGKRIIQGFVSADELENLHDNPDVKFLRIKKIDTNEVGGTKVSQGVKAIGAEELHSKGVMGQGVKIGVIDQGFNVTNPEISNNIYGYKSFSNDISSKDTVHGTAVSEIVVDTAPKSRLYLASTGTITSPQEFSESVEWLVDRGVDIIVYSGTFLTQPSEKIYEAVETASRNNVLFVTSAGNYANKHWQGTYQDMNGNRWLDFKEGADMNFLNDGKKLEGYVHVTLTWENPIKADYDLYLYRYNPSSTDSLVAKSTHTDDGYGSVTATVREGRYYVSIYKEDRSISTFNTRLELFSYRHSFMYRDSTNSLAPPATFENVMSVGAYNYATGKIEDFSSRGPTPDGTRVDIAAPDGVDTVAFDKPFYGTSAAAPYVAGVAALIKSQNTELSPDQIESVLESTANDPDVKGSLGYGHGKVDALEAYKRITLTINLSEVERRSHLSFGTKDKADDDDRLGE